MTPPLNDLHMLALKWILDHELALPPPLAEQLCQELKAAGLIAPAPEH